MRDAVMRGACAIAALVSIALASAATVSCGSSDGRGGATSGGPGSSGDADAGAPGSLSFPPADWIVAIDPAAPPAGKITRALLGQYDLSGALLHYDEVPSLPDAMRAIGPFDWRVGVGRWEVGTRLLPTLTDGAPCAGLNPAAIDPGTDASLIASRDWFTDDGAAVALADTQNDGRYALAYVRSVIDVATAFGATTLVDIDDMPRAFAVNKVPSRTLAAEPNACQMTWTNAVSNVRPEDPYLVASAGGPPPIFASAVVGMVQRIVEGSDGEAPRPARYFEFWNEPELPYAWDPTYDDANHSKFFATAAQVLLLLDAYRQLPSSPKDLKIGFGSFAVAGIAASVIAALDAQTPALPIDFFSFHSYSNDPLAIVSDIEAVTLARKASKSYAGSELALTEWGPELSAPLDPASMDTPLLIATVLALGANEGLNRAYHSILYDFYPAIPFGILDHDAKPKPAYHAYELFSRALGGGGDRLAVTTAPDGRFDAGKGAVLAMRDAASGAIRVVVVNRDTDARTVRVDLAGATKQPTAATVYADPAAPPSTVPPSAVLTLPARSIALLEL